MAKYDNKMKILVDWLDNIIDNDFYEDFKEILLMSLQGKLHTGYSELGDMFLLNSRGAGIEEKKYMLQMLNKRYDIKQKMKEVKNEDN